MSADPVVHVIDDDLAVRQSLLFLLTSDGLLVRVYDSASAFLAKLAEASSGCILTDVRMPGIDGIELLRSLRAAECPLPVVVMTGHADVPLAVSAMKEGAVDFLEKPFDDEALLASVRAALVRRTDSSGQDAHVAELRRRIAGLSEREAQVLGGLVEGKPNKVIAHELGISPRTVEIYRANVMSKMQAGSLSELVRMSLAAAPAGQA